MTMRTLAIALLLSAVGTADGERDNQEDNVRRIPPPGVAVPDADKSELAAGVEALGKEIDALRAELKGKPALDLLPDVQIYHKAVKWALDDVRKHYKVDESRITVRGFSMGGAACWQFAVHFPGKWAAAAPGAGFSETPDFLKVFQNEKLKPTPFEQTLWHMYDCTDYAVNIFNLPTVAYSGEIDKQKQAAAMKKEGLELVHIIGPKTAHSYEKAAKEEVAKRIDEIVAKGRDPLPAKIRFTTWTLQYNESHWVTVDGMEKHWERARVDAELADKSVKATTVNVSGVTFSVPGPLTKVTIDDQSFDAPAGASFHKTAGKWAAGPIPDSGLRKTHTLCGPIDHAFMDSFIMVKPTGNPINEKVGAWAAKEMQHAVEHWRQQYRGDAPMTTDTALTDAQIASSNLILWGDPSSNKVLAKIADKLPLKWNPKELSVGSQTVPAELHAAILIYPNPLNPKKYVVLNSGFTFRDYDYLNNARQIPKLPDWAILDVSTPPDTRHPAKIVTGGFFGEKWELIEPPAPRKPAVASRQ
jgi:hypothetical protein